jgi:hypothetical protein
MIRKFAVAVAILALAAPSVVHAQGGGRQGGGRGMQQNVAALLIEHKDELKLTADQSGKLEEWKKKLDEKNAPLVKQMQEMRDAGTMDREKMQGISAEMRKNNEEAQAEIMKLLDEAQQAAAKEVIANARPQGRRGGGA